MTDFSDAHNAFCRRCRTWFCPEDGGCNCQPEWDEVGDAGEDIVEYNEDDPRKER